jgi:hypothetical protein
MVAKVISNRSGYFMNGAQGVGIENIADQTIAWSAIVGKTGDTYYLAHADLSPPGYPHLGYSFQSSGGATLNFTCAPRAAACNPDPAVQAQVLWDANVTVAAGGAIVTHTQPFSAIKITFTADGELYCVGR